MAKYTKQLQTLVSKYRVQGNPWPASSKEVAAWAIANGLWELPEEAVVRKCAEDISRAMREEYFTDVKGRRVRRKHPVTLVRNGKQMTLWDDMKTAPRSHMQLAFQQRRQQIVGDCRQLSIDVQSYNDLNASEPAIQLVFDFTRDLAELELAA